MVKIEVVQGYLKFYAFLQYVRYSKTPTKMKISSITGKSDINIWGADWKISFII